MFWVKEGRASLAAKWVPEQCLHALSSLVASVSCGEVECSQAVVIRCTVLHWIPAHFIRHRAHQLWQNASGRKPRRETGVPQVRREVQLQRSGSPCARSLQRESKRRGSHISHLSPAKQFCVIATMFSRNPAMVHCGKIHLLGSVHRRRGQKSQWSWNQHSKAFSAVRDCMKQ